MKVGRAEGVRGDGGPLCANGAHMEAIAIRYSMTHAQSWRCGCLWGCGACCMSTAHHGARVHAAGTKLLVP